MGSAFRYRNSLQELIDIASTPSKEHVFQVENFDALRDIQKQLKEKIFAIEGKSEMELLVSEALTYISFFLLEPGLLCHGPVPLFGYLVSNMRSSWASSVAQWKESACSAGATEDVGLTPGSRRCPGGVHGNPLHYSIWRIPCTEEPGRLQSMESHSVGHD